MATARILGLITIAFFAQMSLTSCGTDPIKTVKSGVLQFDKSATVGNVIDGYKYLKERTWTKSEDKQKRMMVLFIGEIDPASYQGFNIGSGKVNYTDTSWIQKSIESVAWYISFTLNQDGTFELTHSAMRVIYKKAAGVEVFDDDNYSIISSIYANTLDRFTATKLGELFAQLQKTETEKFAGIKQEALQVGEKAWSQALTKCNDCYYFTQGRDKKPTSYYVWQVKGSPKVDIKYFEEVDGGYKCLALLDGEAYKLYDRTTNGWWPDWDNSDMLSFGLTMAKIKGTWVITDPGFVDTKPLDCGAIPR